MLQKTHIKVCAQMMEDSMGLLKYIWEQSRIIIHFSLISTLYQAKDLVLFLSLEK